jgi:hypothetical protein
MQEKSVSVQLNELSSSPRRRGSIAIKQAIRSKCFAFCDYDTVDPRLRGDAVRKNIIQELKNPVMAFRISAASEI